MMTSTITFKTFRAAMAGLLVSGFLWQSAFAQNTPTDGGASTLGTYPAGPGGTDVPTPPPARPDPLPTFYDPKLPMEKRVEDLVSRLSLEEKVALMQMASPAIPRLGIAPYHWWTEALHGMTHDTATVFPQAIGLAATFDPELHFQVATAISTEGRAKNVEYRANNIFKSMTGLDFWSPNINIFRDPRWGRGQESYGEDPYLSGRFAIAFVKGIQGEDPVYFRAIATPKHFAVHSGPEAVREQFNAVVTDEDLYSTYLPQFEASVKEGHAYSIMSSYNALNGVPNSGNKRLLTDILRTQWGFNGYVVSDVDSVADIYQANRHAYVPSAVEASALAVKAGNELNSGTTYGGGRTGPSNLAQAVQRGLITQQEVDLAVSRLMAARFRLGEFDPPGYAGNPYNKITREEYNTPQNHELALKAARESMVLLKNANQLLPLKPGAGTIAVMGPNANNVTMQYGNYNGKATTEHQVTVLKGIQAAVGADHVLTLTNLQVPLTGNIALAELVKSDYLFTDASRKAHGLTVSYTTNEAGLAHPIRTEIVESGALPMPAANGGINFEPSLAVKMTGTLVPPASGEYQLGAKGRDAFRLTIDGKLILDESQGGALRTASAPIHLEKDKAYAIVVEFTHSATSGGRGGRGGAGGPGGFGGAPGGGAGRRGAPPGGTNGAAPTGIVFQPDAGAPGGGGGFGGRGGRGGGGGNFGASASAPGVTAAPAADPATTALFQIAWTPPTADGLPANTAGKSLFGEAVDLARKADAIVLVVGIDSTQEGEQRDRNSIELPAVQEAFVRAVTRAAGNKPVVLVNCSGSPIAMTWAAENVPAILQAWYPGQRGDAVADVIFGKVNPAGRLPVTFYRSTAELPAFTDYLMADRTYRYDTKPVLYPFGHGLSYTTFQYSKLTAPSKSATSDDVKISFTVKNTGKIEGDEVVQCYLNRELPEVSRASLPDLAKMSDEQATLLATPRKALVGFARVSLKPGEAKKVTFTVTTQQLSLVVGKDGKREVRPGKLQIQVGGSSALSRETPTRSLTLNGAATAPAYHFVPPIVE